MQMKLLELVAAVSFTFGAQTGMASGAFPSKPIQLVVPLSQATSVDWVARIYSDQLGLRLGQPVIVQNRPGAGGTIAANAVVRADPDGHTIMLVNSQHSINPSLYDKLAYDTIRDFVGVARVGSAPCVIVVNPKLGVRNVKEFVEYAKKNPGELRFASAGVGTTSHLGGAYFASRAGVQMGHVPYKGGEYMADLIAGRVDSMVSPASVMLPHIREGRLVALGVTSKQPLKAPIDVPTVGSAGLSDFEYVTYYGFIAPAKTPKPAIERLAREIKAITETDEVRQKFATQAIFPSYLEPAEFDGYIRSEIERLAPIVKGSGAKAN